MPSRFYGSTKKVHAKHMEVDLEDPYRRFVSGSAAAVEFKINDITHHQWCDLVGEMIKHTRAFPARDGRCPVCTPVRKLLGDVPTDQDSKRKRREEDSTCPNRPPLPRFDENIKFLRRRAYEDMPTWATGPADFDAEAEPTVFKFFLNFPREIQDMIYEASVTPVEIHMLRAAYDPDRYWQVATPRKWQDLPLYHVCRRSRARMVALFGQPCKLTDGIPIDPVHDALSYSVLRQPAITTPWIRMRNEAFVTKHISLARRMKITLCHDHTGYYSLANYLNQVSSMMNQVFQGSTTFELRHLTIEMDRYTSCAAARYAETQGRRKRKMAFRSRQLHLFTQFLLWMTHYNPRLETFEPAFGKLETICLSRPESGYHGSDILCSAVGANGVYGGEIYGGEIYGGEWCVADPEEVDRIVEDFKARFTFAAWDDSRDEKRLGPLGRMRRNQKLLRECGMERVEWSPEG
ncbi:hypothetical protein B0T14DRAFT_549301 [Immersiella caudata]|uniref:2EXR domain-containing protein n=1 Tax=Immersiella caudata TaxID=314043 RepID=A0AA39XCP7_9PEZI|nr:hypothetical protein B0T14DRAFT_549301 [Immersiella caudata]